MPCLAPIASSTEALGPADGTSRSPDPTGDVALAGVPVGRPDVLLVGGALLIALQTVVRTLVVLPSWYWQDDFVHLDLARRLGLTADYLIRDHNRHLEIGANAVYWLVGRPAGSSFLLPALTLVAMQLVTSCLMLAVLRQLFGRSPWLLVPLAAYLFTPLGLVTATWWAAGLEAMPLQIAMLTALYGLVRAVRERSWGWAVLSVGGTALGLLFWEKAVVIPPTLVAVLLLVEWGDEPVRRRLRMLAAQWRYLVPQVLLVVAYLPLYLAVIDLSPGPGLDRGDVDPGTPLTAAFEAISRMLVPGMFGGPWTDQGAANTLYPDGGVAATVLFAGLLVVVVGASVWLRGPRALQGWLLAAAYVAVDLALVQVGRNQYLYLVARDPRYVTDALVVVTIGVCAAFSGPRVREVRLPFRATLLAPVLAALLVVSGLVTTAALAPGLQHRSTKRFVEDVLQAMAGEPGASVISARPPGFVSVAPEPLLGALLASVGYERPFDRPGTDLRMFDAKATLRPVTLLEPRLQATGPVPGCGWQLDRTWQQVGELSSPSEDIEVLRIEYRATGPVVLEVAVGDDRQHLDLPPGAGSASFVVTGQQGLVQVRATGAEPATTCVDSAVAGVPWPLGL